MQILDILIFKMNFVIMVPNSLSSRGKLTLKTVHFTYENSERGRLSPYMFDYRESEPDYNPAYTEFHYDRWGTYRLPDDDCEN